MSLLGYLSCTQKHAGSPIAMSYRVVANLVVDDVFDYWGVGTTNDTTPPTQMSGFAHREYASQRNAFLGQAAATQVYRQIFSADGSTIIRYSDSMSYEGATKSLDSNYAAGKYLWAFMTVTDPATNGTAPVALAGPYRIR